MSNDNNATSDVTHRFKIPMMDILLYCSADCVNETCKLILLNSYAQYDKVLQPDSGENNMISLELERITECVKNVDVRRYNLQVSQYIP
jgi:hypothetical protein